MSSQRRHVKAKKPPTNAIEKKKVEPPRPSQALLQKFALLAANVENNVQSHASRLAEWEKIGPEVSFTTTGEAGVVKAVQVAGLPDLISQVRDTMRDTTEAVTTCRQYVSGELNDLCDNTQSVIAELEQVIACQKSKMASQDEVIAAYEGIIEMMKTRDAKKEALIDAVQRERDSVSHLIRSMEANVTASDQRLVVLGGQMKSLRGDFDTQKKMRLADKKELEKLRALCARQEKDVALLRQGHDECSICFEVARVRVMKPCGHTACDACASQLKHCHYCRTPVLSTVLLFPSPLCEG